VYSLRIKCNFKIQFCGLGLGVPTKIATENYLDLYSARTGAFTSFISRFKKQELTFGLNLPDTQ
jgi:hypothetical protein